MSSLFVPEDESYDDRLDSSKRDSSEYVKDQDSDSQESELPPVDISIDRTQEYYRSLNDGNQEEPTFPVVVKEKSEEVPIYDTTEVCCNLPLSFQQDIAETFLSKDCLMVLARGLGCETITANVLYALSPPSVSLHSNNVVREKRSLIILLNAKSEEHTKLNELLMELKWMNSVRNQEDESHSNDDSNLPLRVVNASDLNNTTRRRAVYEEGGILSISSRVLVVDLLSGMIRPGDITGIFLMHSERTKETSNESFIINLYRDENKWGFVKAITDEPESFTGFTPLATKLKNLRLSSVFLWPRFHVEVSSSLIRASKNHDNTVIEVSVGLSAKMKKIQSALLSCLQACLNELKRHNPTLDTEYLDMENVHDRDFVIRARLLLEPQWHRISWTSKQLISDVATLKDLLSDLLTEDALTYYQKVQGILDSNIKRSRSGTMSNTAMSPWLMMDEATTVISYSRERALGKVTIQKQSIDLESKDETEAATSTVYNLEELPKWNQLCIILDDVIHEKMLKPSASEGPVLIMCSSPKITQQITQVLACCKKRENHITGKKRFSSRSYMASILRNYFHWKEISSLRKDISNKLESQAGEEGSASDSEILNTSKSFNRGNGSPLSKRRRVRGAAAVANVAQLYAGSSFDKFSGAVELEKGILANLESEVKAESDEEKNDSHNWEVEENHVNDDSDLSKCDLPTSKFDHIEKFDQVIVETFDGSTDELLLQELKPSYIVLYEPDVTFIRRVELFQAMNSNSPAKVYFMYYGTSVEEQSHLTKIKNEKQAFTKLIKEKASLSKHFATENDNWKFKIRKPNVVNTRIAGGAQFRTIDDEMKVIVDTREFSSPLPNILYRSGIKVIPCMLTVGDFIISPKICVERKAIPDLISSFKSGRLYQQCEQMFRHYEMPTLLIEFNENKSFSFMPFLELKPPGQKVSSSVGAKLQNRDIQSKISELLVSFPKLKILWSSSAYETAQIFLELKLSQQEPSIEEALAKGVNPSIATNEGPPNYNDDAIDVLQTIPGINNSNYTSVLQRVKNLADLVKLSKDDFIELLGHENANKAYNFINHEIH